MTRIKFDPELLEWLSMFSPALPEASFTDATATMIRAYQRAVTAAGHTVAWEPHAALAGHDQLRVEVAPTHTLLIASMSAAAHAQVSLTLLHPIDGVTVMTGAAVTDRDALQPDMLDPISRSVDCDSHAGRLTLGYGFRRDGRDFTLKLHRPLQAGGRWSGALVVLYRAGDQVADRLVRRLTANADGTRRPLHRRIGNGLTELNEPASHASAFGERMDDPAAVFDRLVRRLPLSPALLQPGRQPHSGLAHRG